MKEITKRIIILFLLMCVIFSTIDIRAFQSFATEIEKEKVTEQQPQNEDEEILNGKNENLQSENGVTESFTKENEEEEKNEKEETQEEKTKNESNSEEKSITQSESIDEAEDKEEEIKHSDELKKIDNSQPTSITSSISNMNELEATENEYDFTYYYENNSNNKISCNSEDLNNVIAENKGNLIIELNKNIEIEGTTNKSGLIFGSSSNSYTLKLNNHTIKAKASGYNIIHAVGTNLKIENGTLTGADSTSSVFRSTTNSQHGGAIYSENSNLTISSVHITNNKGNYGSGIYSNNSTLNFNNVELKNNSASWGAGIYSENNVNKNNTFNNVTIDSNTATTKIAGIYFKGSGNLQVNESKILSNTGKNGNAGITVEGGSSDVVKVTVENTKINQNTSSYGNTGISVTNKNTNTPIESTINGCEISGNTPNSFAMAILLSGEVTLNANQLNITNNGNDTTTSKGAIVIENSSTISKCNKITIENSIIKNNTFGKNSVNKKAAGISIDSYGNDISIKDTIISENKGVFVGGISIYRRKSNIPFNFNMESGAIYNNKAINEYDKHPGIYPNDVYVNIATGAQNNEIKLPSVEKMAEKESTLTDHYWNQFLYKNNFNFESLQPNESITYQENGGSSAIENIYNVSDTAKRYVAQIDTEKYETLSEAFNSAEDNDTIELIAGESDNSGNKITETIEYNDNKHITVDLNGKEWEGKNGEKALTLNNDSATITIKGQGNISGIDYLKGKLELTSNAYIKEIKLGKGCKIFAKEDFNIQNPITLTIDKDDIATVNSYTDLVLIQNNTGRDLSKIIDYLNIKGEGIASDIVAKNDNQNNIVLHKLTGIFVGDSGNDDNSGDTAQDCVLTFEKAKLKAIEKLAKNTKIDGIFVVGGITVNKDNTTWSLPESISLCRYDTKNLVIVKKDCELTLENITIDGRSEKIQNASSLIKVEDDATLNIKDGTSLQNNNSNYSGGAVNCEGKVIMTGGTIKDNYSNYIGGGIYVDDKGTLELGVLNDENSNPIITNNTALVAGGGIGLCSDNSDNTESKMNSGEISHNKTTGATGSEWSFAGGVLVGDPSYRSNTKFIMNDGKISENTTDTNGGGMLIATGSIGILNKGEITNNSCNASIYTHGSSEYGGGAIYVNGERGNYFRGVLKIPTTAYISDNTSASANGAGIAGCQTSVVNIYDGGASIFNNTKKSGDTKDLSQVYVTKSEDSNNISEANISKYAIHGIPNDWTDTNGNTLSKKDLTLSNDNNDDIGRVIKLKNNNSENLEKTKNWADVKITGNSSNNSMGGGIGTNGEVDIGDEDTDYEVEFNVNKTWEDQNNQYSTRPHSITVNLYANGEFVKSQEITEEDGWKYKFEELPKCDNNGDEITYTVSEVKVNGYESTIEETINGANITNKEEVVSLQGEKIWNDGNNKDQLRPNSITVNLFANGTKMDSKTITADDEWKYSFENIPKYDENNNLIVYTITEDAVDGYVSSIEGTNITNTQVFNLQGEKIWKDENNKKNSRPNSITVNLFANDVKVDSKTITADDEWKYSFENLPKYDENNNLIVYTLTEDAVKGYETTIEGTNIINTYVDVDIDVDKNVPQKTQEMKFSKMQQIKPPKTGGILENQSLDQKEIISPIISPAFSIMLLTITFINTFRLMRRKK